MANQSRYLLFYLCVLCTVIGGVIPLAQAQEINGLEQHSEKQDQAERLNQAELDQILAPIALYPDTLLSHILVASTYPLEVVQAARWRAKKQDLDESAALEAVEVKDWDPSVKALVPFNDLLQQFNEDLDWLQALGEAFLLNEEQVLTSVQGLRQKAYAQGNLQDNDYLDVDQDEGQIIIKTLEKEVVYVPYYDTRVVYGSWWWGAYPPHYWHRPNHYVWNSGFYWSPRFYIRPSFYFGGFHWPNHHLVVDYHYRNTSNRNWQRHSGHSSTQTVRVSEYPRWSHNTAHRRGVRYQHSQNANRYVSSKQGKRPHQIDKQRVLNVEHLKNKHRSDQVKQGLAATKKGHKRQSADNNPSAKPRQGRNRQASTVNSSANRDKPNGKNNPRRLIRGANDVQHSKAVKQPQGERKMQQQTSSLKTQQAHSTPSPPYVQKQTRYNAPKRVYRSSESNNHSSRDRANSNERQGKSQRRTSSTHNKSRSVNTPKSRSKESRH